MYLSDEHLQAFITLCQEKLGRTITISEALEEGSALVNLIRTVILAHKK